MGEKKSIPRHPYIIMPLLMVHAWTVSVVIADQCLLWCLRLDLDTSISSRAVQHGLLRRINQNPWRRNSCMSLTVYYTSNRPMFPTFQARRGLQIVKREANYE